MSLFSCPDCIKPDCTSCFRYISSRINGLEKIDSAVMQSPMHLFALGNIVYYLYDEQIETQQNCEYKLEDFPSSSYWVQQNLNGKTVKIVARDETDEELFYYASLRVYGDTTLILPLDENAIFSSIINDTIVWTVSKTLKFIYISCEEICFNSQKIMHDPYLYIDTEKNKIGIKNPLPFVPDDQHSYILKSINGKIEWILDDERNKNI